MNVLSCFDGISCGQVALNRIGIKYDNYYASEIDKNAIKVTQSNYPNTIQLGSITGFLGANLPKIELLAGGSPCQGFSFAGDQLNFEDPRSKLFFEFLRLKEELSPKYFLLENVRMKKESMDVISKSLGVEPIKINSSLVCAQNRPRLYWTNIPNITQPQDKNLLVKDVLLNGDFPKLTLSEKAVSYMSRLRNGKPRWEFHSNPLNGKAACLTANMCKGVPYGVIKELNRRFHPIECERLQTLPDDYTKAICDTQRLKSIGNGWTVDVIAHIFKNMETNIEK